MKYLMILLAASVVAIAHEGKEEFDDSGRFRDSGIRGPKYSTMERQLKKVVQSHKGFAEFVTYGKSVFKRNLNLIRIAKKGSSSGGRAILVSGSTHGNEYLNIVDRLPKALLEKRTMLDGVRSFLDKGHVLYVVPVVNPDGYDWRLRRNANRVDLNRDFDLIPLKKKNFKEPETSKLIEYVERDLASEKLDLVMTVDYHCCQGSYVYPWSYTRKSMTPEELKRHRKFGGAMAAFLGKRYKIGSSFDLLGYLAQGTSKDYYFARHGALAFTFEGVRRRENKNFSHHLKIWDFILREFAK